MTVFTAMRATQQVDPPRGEKSCEDQQCWPDERCCVQRDSGRREQCAAQREGQNSMGRINSSATHCRTQGHCATDSCFFYFCFCFLLCLFVCLCVCLVGWLFVSLFVRLCACVCFFVCVSFLSVCLFWACVLFCCLNCYVVFWYLCFCTHGRRRDWRHRPTDQSKNPSSASTVRGKSKLDQRKQLAQARLLKFDWFKLSSRNFKSRQNINRR